MKTVNLATLIGFVVGTLGNGIAAKIEAKTGMVPGSLAPLVGAGAAWFMRKAAKLDPNKSK